MGWSIPLRDWQRAAVLDWGRRQPPDYLVCATPGAGKTLYLGAVATGALEGRLIRRLVVVVPTTTLRMQWTTALAGVGIQLEPNYTAGMRIPRGLHGAVITYQQLLEDPYAYTTLVDAGTMLAFDEIHHAGLDSVWGKATEIVGEHARYRVHLSGTPFRSDKTKIAHLTYDDRGYVVADYVYGYREGLADSVVRPLVFYPQGATVKWEGSDGVVREATFEDIDLEKPHAAARLRAVLEHEGWLADVVTRADAALDSVRRFEPDAGALAVCMNEAHARFVAQVVRRVTGTEPTIVVSADADADHRLAVYRANSTRWLIAVRKVAEGVDVQRLRVLAYFTNARAELLFKQIIGRVVRTRKGDARPAFVFLPADDQLLALAAAVSDEVHGRWEKVGTGNSMPLEGDGDPEEDGRGSLIVHDAQHYEMRAISYGTVDPTSLLAPVRDTFVTPTDGVVMAHERARGRAESTHLANAVAMKFSLHPREVQGYWKVRQGAGVAEASPADFEKRVAIMKGWLENGRCPIKSRAGDSVTSGKVCRLAT